jgi:hypothetical protein
VDLPGAAIVLNGKIGEFLVCKGPVDISAVCIRDMCGMLTIFAHRGEQRNPSCRVWDRTAADVKGEEGCSIEGATVSDYIHNQDE